jgi:hypothetical protein
MPLPAGQTFLRRSLPPIRAGVGADDPADGGLHLVDAGRLTKVAADADVAFFLA